MQHLLKRLEFGYCPDALQDFEKRCHALFPLATAFKPPPPPPGVVDGEAAVAEVAPGIKDSNGSKAAAAAPAAS